MVISRSFSLLFLLAISLFSPLNSLKFLGESEFNPIEAKNLWYYEVASYCSPSNIQIWNVSTVADIFPKVQEITVFTNSTGDNQAYTAFDPVNNIIILAVRGSANIENWFQNLDAFKTDYAACSGCEVHAGFNDAYLDLKDSMLPSLFDLKTKHPTGKVAVLGHSLGAAIVTLALVDISEKIDVAYFYTFGSPRVGNPAFSNFINTNFPYVFKGRLTHSHDPVPHLPLDSMGFIHIDSEVYYVEDNSSYTLCLEGQEDPNCANQYDVIDFDIADHKNYMGFNQADFKVKCL